MSTAQELITRIVDAGQAHGLITATEGTQHGTGVTYVRMTSVEVTLIIRLGYNPAEGYTDDVTVDMTTGTDPSTWRSYEITSYDDDEPTDRARTLARVRLALIRRGTPVNHRPVRHIHA